MGLLWTLFEVTISGAIGIGVGVAVLAIVGSAGILIAAGAALAVAAAAFTVIATAVCDKCNETRLKIQRMLDQSLSNPKVAVPKFTSNPDEISSSTAVEVFQTPSGYVTRVRGSVPVYIPQDLIGTFTPLMDLIRSIALLDEDLTPSSLTENTLSVKYPDAKFDVHLANLPGEVRSALGALNEQERRLLLYKVLKGSLPSDSSELEKIAGGTDYDLSKVGNVYNLLSSVKMAFLSNARAALKYYVIVAVVDGVTGEYKSHRLYRVPVNFVSTFRAYVDVFPCDKCPWSSDSKMITNPYYMLTVLDTGSGFKVNTVPFELVLDKPVKVGDILKVYLVSPTLTEYMREVCCNESSPCKDPEQAPKHPECGSCSAFKDATGVGICSVYMCSAGEIMFPEIFVGLLEKIGYYNPAIVSFAKTVANGGFFAVLAEVPITANMFSSDADPQIKIDVVDVKEGGTIARSSIVFNATDDGETIQTAVENAYSSTTLGTPNVSVYLEDRNTAEGSFALKRIVISDLSSLIGLRISMPASALQVAGTDVDGRSFTLLADTAGLIQGGNMLGFAYLASDRRLVILDAVVKNAPQWVALLPTSPDCYQVSGGVVTVKEECLGNVSDQIKRGIETALSSLSGWLRGWLERGYEVISFLPQINAVVASIRSQ